LSRSASGELDSVPIAIPPEDGTPGTTEDLADERPVVLRDGSSRTMSGELWSETIRRTPDAAAPRTQRRPDTPLPRPASNVPLDLGEGPDPASWFDSVSLPHAAAPSGAPGLASGMLA